jgi:hypothetical protein
MTPKELVWFSLVGMGFMVTFFIPISAVLGFSLGVFFAALSYNYIGYKGLLFYYALWIPNSAINMLSMNQAFANQVALFELYYTGVEYSLTYVSMFVFYSAYFLSLPLLWFISCRKLAKKLRITEQVGLLKNLR